MRYETYTDIYIIKNTMYNSYKYLTEYIPSCQSDVKIVFHAFCFIIVIG